MIGATLSDLGLLVPELILVGMASALILAARRIQRAPVAVVGTVLAALAATLVAVWDLSLWAPGPGLAARSSWMVTPNSSRSSSA